MILYFQENKILKQHKENNQIWLISFFVFNLLFHCKLGKSRILQQAKTECENLIQTRLEILPSLYVNKREFDNFRTSVSKTYLPATTFETYRKQQETKLKSIDGKLNHRFSLLSITLHNEKTAMGTKATFHMTLL